MATNTAPIKWAQRSDSLYLTIALPDVKDETIQLTDKELHFKGKSQDKDYSVDIEFFQSVDSEGSTYKVLPRSIQMHIMKPESAKDEDFWPRLLKDKALEKNQVQIDWDRYIDDKDDEDEAGGFDTSALAGGMGMGGMGGGMGGMGGGMGGMGGMDMEALMQQMGSMGGAGGDEGDDEDEGDDDDDDDDLPDLEES